MRTVFFISDSTGITAETLGHALLSQFEAVEYRQVTIPFVDDDQKTMETIALIKASARDDGQRPIVFSTITHPALHDALKSGGALVLDLFNVFIRPLELEFDRGSTHATGAFHGMTNSASYAIRIDAVDFALKHDDGGSVRHYKEADLILVGVSRSGKTPTCIYLSMQFGIRAANYPVVEEDIESGGLPKPLRPHKGRLFGLTIDPERLHQIRSERRPNSHYASLSQCRREVVEVEAMFRHERIKFLSSSAISVEEIASRILQQTGLKRRLY